MSALRNKNEMLGIIASLLGDKFDRSMTLGKLLDNDTQIFIFISVLIMTQHHPRDPENRQQNRFLERRFWKKTPVTTGWMGNWALSVNNAQFVSVDLIGEKNQVKLNIIFLYFCLCGNYFNSFSTTRDCTGHYLVFWSYWTFPHN